MHYVCFHYEFEHGATDVNLDCGAGGCPAGVLPSANPSEAAQAALHEAVDGLRRPYDPTAWKITFVRPGVGRLERDYARVRLVAVDAPPR